MKHMLMKATFMVSLAVFAAGVAHAEPVTEIQEQPATISPVEPVDTGFTGESVPSGEPLQIIPVDAEGNQILDGHAVDPAHAENAAVHGGAHDAGHHESAGLPQLDPAWFASQAFWLLLTFGFLYVIFSRNILPAISNTLENRHEHVQGDLDMAQKLKTEAEQVFDAYNKSLENARSRATKLYHDVEEDIKVKSERQQNELRERLAKEMELSEARLLKTKNDALKEMDTIAAEIASAAAEKIVGISTDIKTAREIVQGLNSKDSKKAA